ncbi:uncharacterized protein [Drosophila virilis]|uniref:proteasome endopeptidase complex n=1 Tax=Drosophila virilis TaxID=7244 RepID=B4LHM0_DROVI|nr:proteasome subunit beta type-2 [Drosophila virilis]EDW69573.1 uncharacterized protein Dvir_GJ13326 [Drosophila virilis]
MISNNNSFTIRHCYGGFNYENYLRNAELMQTGFHPPLPFNSGTTVVGLHFNKGVMIGTDTRATRRNIVSSAESPKIRRLHNNIYCGGSGYASDLDNLTQLLEKQLELHYKSINQRHVPVVCAKQLTKEALMQNLGRIMVSFVIGGVDKSGVHLYSVHFDGTSEKCLYNSVGSGQFGAMGILEDRWQLGLEEDDARELMVDAVTAGINNDLASGTGVDLCIIRTDYTVELCSEVVYGALRSDRDKLPDKERSMVLIRENVLRCIEITEENVIPLKPVTPMPVTGTPPPRPPIRRDEVRRTVATMRLQRKRSAEDLDDEGPPRKRRSLSI